MCSPSPLALLLSDNVTTATLANMLFEPLPAQAWELEKLRNTTQQGMYSKEAQFRRRQANELLALNKRIQTGRDEQKKQRQQDLERLLQRYQNVKSELEAQQNLERIRADRYVGQTASTLGMAGGKGKKRG